MAINEGPISVILGATHPAKLRGDGNSGAVVEPDKGATMSFTI